MAGPYVPLSVLSIVPFESWKVTCAGPKAETALAAKPEARAVESFMVGDG